MHPGDTIVLYTDGATDVAPPHGLTTQAFEDLVGECVQAGASADQVAEHLHAALTTILPIHQRRDDIALLVLRATDLGGQG